MKTFIRRYIGIAFLFVLGLVSFSSCEVSFFEEPPYISHPTPEDYLCGPVWTDIWDEGHHLYEQRFVFFRNGSGVEYFTDNGKEWRYEFYWNWDRGSMHHIRMEYADGTSYFDDIIIEGGILSGYLNNEYVEFTAR